MRRVVIVLDVHDGDLAEVVAATDRALDYGTVQDAIADAAGWSSTDRIVSALVDLVETGGSS